MSDPLDGLFSGISVSIESSLGSVLIFCIFPSHTLAEVRGEERPSQET